MPFVWGKSYAHGVVTNDDQISPSMLIVDVGRILFIGHVGVVEEHRVMVPIFAAGLDDEYEITVNGAVERVRTRIASADQVRSVDGLGKRLAVMPIDPALSPPGEPADPTRCVELLNVLAHEFSLEVWVELCSAIGLDEPDTDRPVALLEAMRLVRQSSDENVAGAEIAEQVGFSLSHLQHLFRAHVGTSIRSYRTWSRFVSLASGLADGLNITDAAAAAGFFDSAHVARSFSQTFGVSPSFVFGGKTTIHVVASTQDL